jgi:hypothetical protein
VHADFDVGSWRSAFSSLLNSVKERGSDGALRAQRSTNDYQHLHYYCWKVIAEGVGQRRVSVVVLRPDPPALKVQHSSSVEQ